MTTNCQHCQKELNVQLPLDIGQGVKCPYCDAMYEVVWLYPLELAPQRGLPPRQRLLRRKRKES